jgi:hypothetical protein
MVYFVFHPYQISIQHSAHLPYHKFPLCLVKASQRIEDEEDVARTPSRHDEVDDTLLRKLDRSEKRIEDLKRLLDLKVRLSSSSF